MASETLARGSPQIPQRTRFQDFAPDVDPITPNVLLDINNFYPTAKGYRSYASLVKYSSNSLPSAALGAWAGLQGSNSIAVAGVSGQIYILSGQAWTTAGLTLSGTTGRWRFDMYGTDLVGVDGVNPPQMKPLSSGFAALGGSPPTASIVQATDYSLFLIEPNSNKYWSTLSDVLWTPSIATQTVTDRIASTPGNITAAHKLRSGIAMYKRKALHNGYFVGPPNYWDFRKVSDQVGVASQEAVANLGDIQYFPGPDDFYSFDGYSLNRMPNNLKEWFFTNLDQNFDFNIVSRWDQALSLVFWHFPSIAASPGGTLDTWICYNLRTGKWAKGSETIDIPIFSAIQTGDLTYGVFTTTYPTYADVAGLLYGDLVSRTNDVSGVIKKSDHALYLYNGAPGAADYTTHAFGDGHSLFLINRAQPGFTIYPEQGATLQVLEQRKSRGKAFVNGPTATLTADGWFDFVNTARLQKLKVTCNSEAEVTEMEVPSEYAGDA